MAGGLVEIALNQPMHPDAVTSLNWVLKNAIYAGGAESHVMGLDFHIHHGRRKSTFYFRDYRIFEFDHTKKNTGYKLDPMFQPLVITHQKEFFELKSHVDWVDKGCWSWDEDWHKKAQIEATKRLFYYYN